jgi:hypothetical protein
MRRSGAPLSLAIDQVAFEVEEVGYVSVNAGELCRAFIRWN